MALTLFIPSGQCGNVVDEGRVGESTVAGHCGGDWFNKMNIWPVRQAQLLQERRKWIIRVVITLSIGPKKSRWVEDAQHMQRHIASNTLCLVKFSMEHDLNRTQLSCIGNGWMNHWTFFTLMAWKWFLGTPTATPPKNGFWWTVILSMFGKRRAGSSTRLWLFVGITLLPGLEVWEACRRISAINGRALWSQHPAVASCRPTIGIRLYKHHLSYAGNGSVAFSHLVGREIRLRLRR